MKDAKLFLIFGVMSICLMVSQQLFSQNKRINMESKWAKVDEFMNDNLPGSAEKYYNTEIKPQLNKSEPDMYLKGQIFEYIILMQKLDDVDLVYINLLKKIQEQPDVPSTAIWHNITARLLDSYFQNRQWEISQRTPVAGTTPENFGEWSRADFELKIMEHFHASLAEVDALQQIKLQTYAFALSESKNIYQLWPTLYDLLASKALNYYSQKLDAGQLISINDARLFSDASSFSQLNLKTLLSEKDSTAITMLHTYQLLLQDHADKGQLEALIHHDMERLHAVHEMVQHSLRNQWYYDALLSLYQKYPNTANGQLAKVESLSFILNGEGGNVKHNYTKADIVAQLKSIVASNETSAATNEAIMLLKDLENKQISLEVENTNLPNENSLIRISYKNISKTHFKLYKVSTKWIMNRQSQEEFMKSLAKLTPMDSWEVALPKGDDYEAHTTETLLRPLAAGQYVLVALSDESIGSAKTYVTFQVSNIAYAEYESDKNKSMLIVNRTTGEYLPNATIQLFQHVYNNTTKKYEDQLKETVVANKDGILDYAAIKALQGNNYANLNTIIIVGSDSFISRRYFRNYNSSYDYTDATSSIFTDRAIYRPGQTVFFKGIVYGYNSKNPYEKKVVVDRQVEVTLLDANYQEVERIKLYTNKYGSYQGSFKLPTGLLNGYFHIKDNYGDRHFSVEEYKRPKFYISYDTLKSNYALGDNIIVPGKVMAYAGNPIDNAVVKYKVVRNVHYPFFYRGWGWWPTPSSATILSSGMVQTDASGAFQIPVTLTPDNAVDKSRLPSFNYEIEVDVTDINGETHTMSTHINAGYAPYLIKVSSPKDVSPHDLKDIKISTENYNGVVIDKPVNITISKLNYPGYYKKRLWDKPNTPMYSKAAFHQLFPTMEYENESDPTFWENGAAIQKWERHLISDNALDFSKIQFKQNGYYRIEVVDPTDDKLRSEAIFHFYNPALNSNAEKPLHISVDKKAYEPGDQLSMRMSSALPKVYPNFVEQNHLQTTVFYKQSSLNRHVTESDRGGVAYNGIIFYQNRMYQQRAIAPVSWNNKVLDISWATHRDKLLPGSKETWTMTIRGEKKEAIAAELMSVLYDASLDALTPHDWNALKHLYPSIYLRNFWNVYDLYSTKTSNVVGYYEMPSYKNAYYAQTFPDWWLIHRAFVDQYNMYGGRVARNMPVATMRADSNFATADVAQESAAMEKSAQPITKKAQVESDIENAPKNAQDVAPPLRSNFEETAYFIPQLESNDQGEVVIKFTIPESLTEWKMMSVAHTPDMRVGYIDGTVKTQKDIMVQPNMPRYFRQNDSVVLSTKLVNMTDAAVEATAQVQILDPDTKEILDLPFRLTQVQRHARIGANASEEVNWVLHVPEARYAPVLVRIQATAGTHTDGEEHLIPVLTNRTLVTETMALPITGSQDKKFVFKSMLDNTSSTISHRAFTFEFTANPTWYAVQALPYLKDYPYDCAEQTFSKIYANAISHNIVKQQPAIVEIFKQWKDKDTSALLSNLEKNQALKSALLQETPWVMEAQDESAQKQQIAALFDEKNIQAELKIMTQKLLEKQNADGGWSWFPGMQSNIFITQYIATGYGKLKNAQAHQSIEDLNSNMVKAVQFLDRWLVESFKRLQKENKDWAKMSYVDAYMINYLYMRSFYKEVEMDKEVQEANNFYYKVAIKDAVKLPLFNKAQMAIIAQRKKDIKPAQLIVQSLQENALVSEELGMYWKNMPKGYYWYEAPIETQALIIEAFQEVNNDEAAINLMKTWLIKQKQTQHWGTTKATTDAIYALLLKGENWLSENPKVTAQIGTQQFSLEDEKTMAGTGYFKHTWTGTEVQRDMANIHVKVEQPTTGAGRPSWGAAYWQYFKDLDKIKDAPSTPIIVTKEVYVRRVVNQQEQLIPIRDGHDIQLGDRVSVRMVVKVDRDMEYLHLKDMRAAAFEPVDVLSGYQYKAGVGYYASISDASMNYFFDRLNKGTYVLEYDLFANAKGNYSNGITTIQCMYAPEFTAHTKGIRVEVK